MIDALNKLCGEINLFPNVNGAAAKVYEWIGILIMHLTGHGIAHSCRD